MEALGPVLGIRNVKMELWGTLWDPHTVKMALWTLLEAARSVTMRCFGSFWAPKGTFGTLLGGQRPQQGALLAHFLGTNGPHGGYKKHP